MGVDEKDNNDEPGFGARLMSGLKDLILEEDAPVAGKAGGEKVVDARVSSPAMAPATSSTHAMPPPLPNSPMTKSLMEQVLNRATAYTALTEAMTPLEEIIPDEMTRYRAAFAVIKKSRSLDQVIQAIDLQHMQVLDDEMLRFASQAKQKEAADIDSRIAEAQTLKGNIEAAELQAVKLREDIETRIRTIQEGVQRDSLRVDEINREVNEKRQAIASVQRQFDGAAASVRESLLQAKAKILKYLSA
jgi:hypothetical protein